MNASQKANDRSWKIIRNTFERAVPNGSDYTLCYAYWMKSGLFSKTMYNYALGFRADTWEIVLVPINSDGSPTGAPLRLQRSDVSQIGKTLQGYVKITSSLTDKPLYFAVPYFLPDAVENTYQLPINQHQEAERFYAMLKNH
jgi:hypothetical protein